MIPALMNVIPIEHHTEYLPMLRSVECWGSVPKCELIEALYAPSLNGLTTRRRLLAMLVNRIVTGEE